MELPLFPLGWAEIQGPDAQDFLHRLSTVPVKNLKLGQGKQGFFLDGVGKIQSFFTLWKLSEDHFAFEFPLGQNGQWQKALEQSIEKFHFSEKFKLHFRSGSDAHQGSWLFTSKELGHSRFQIIPCPDGFITHQGQAPFGHPWYVVWNFSQKPLALPEELQKNEISLSPEQLETERILSLYPHPDRELSTERIPLELGFREAFEEAKGCFPGHEVTERLLRTQATPQRLALFEWEGSCQVGDSVFLEKAAQKPITKLTSCSQTNMALGFVPRMNAQVGKEFFLSQGTLGKIKALA